MAATPTAPKPRPPKNPGDVAKDLPQAARAIVKIDVEKGGKGAKQSAKIRSWLFRGTGAGDDFDLKDLPKLAADDKNMAWVDLSGPFEKELKQVSDLLDLHPVAIEATVAPWQRPRIDTFQDHFYLSVTLAEADLKKLKVNIGSLDIFMGKNYLITAHRNELPFLEKVVERVHQSSELVRYHTAFVLYIVLDEMLDYYQRQYEELEERIEAVEESALRDNSDGFLSSLLRLKRYVFLLGRLAEQHRVVFAAFTRPDFDFISGNDVEPYFKDLQQRLDQFVERLFGARDAVNGAFDIYVSQISHRTNSVLKLLAVVSTVLLPATLIVGFFATSFPDLRALHSLAAFAVMVGLLITVPAVTLFVLIRRKVI